jgi:hypothetical protein
MQRAEPEMENTSPGIASHFGRGMQKKRTHEHYAAAWNGH